jgi:hypothetical protein
MSSEYKLRCEGDNDDLSVQELIRAYAYGMNRAFDFVFSHVAQNRKDATAVKGRGEGL